MGFTPVLCATLYEDWMDKFESYIHGKVVASAGSALPLVCPIDLSHAGDIIDTSDDVVELAVRDAAGAFQAARKLSAVDRIAWLTRAADAIDGASDGMVDLIIRDIGKQRRSETLDRKIVV